MRWFFCCLTAAVLALGGAGCDSGMEQGVPKDADKTAPPPMPGMDVMKAKMKTHKNRR